MPRKQQTRQHHAEYGGRNARVNEIADPFEQTRQQKNQHEDRHFFVGSKRFLLKRSKIRQHQNINAEQIRNHPGSKVARRFRALDQIEAQEQIHLFGRYGLPRFNEHRTAREIHRFHLGSGFFLRARGFYSVGNVGRLQVSFVNRFAQRFEPDRIRRQRQAAFDFGKYGRLIVLRNARA